MAPATRRHMLDVCVPALLPADVAPLQDAQVIVIILKSFRPACRRAPGFDAFHMDRGDNGNELQLLDAAHILLTHCYHILLTVENVDCLRELVW